MKKLMIIMLSCFGFVSIAVAQNADMSKQEKYERYFDKMLDMDYKMSTIKALDLTSEEIEEFTPMFERYLEKKENLSKKRMELLEDLKEELAEDDSKKNEEEDRADFIENYWEVDIDEMKLKKDFFDDLEDKIALRKAAKFFLWEEMMEDRMKQNILVEIIPITSKMYDLDDRSGYNSDREKMNERAERKEDKMVSKGYDSSDKMKRDTKKGYASQEDSDKMMKEIKTSVDDFNSWMDMEDGKVDLSHDYTYNGVQKIMNVLSVMNDNKALNISSFDTEKEKIMNMVAKLKDDPMSDKHADIAKNTFTAIAKLMNNNSALTKAANKIDTNTLMTKQASTIKNFFKVTNTQLQDMSHASVKSEKKMKNK